jgi:hypothetical protein
MGTRTTPESRTDRDAQVRKVNLEEKSAPAEASAKDQHKEYSDNTVPLHPNPVKYDLARLNEFVDTVFHTDVSDDAEVFVQISKRAPAGFGSTVDEALNPRLDRTEAPMQAYYSTSMLRMLPDSTVFRHTKEAFVSWHVLVLDDIGTKIPFDDLPESMPENYRIETSEGNFQLGYILKDPMVNYDEAQAFISLFVDAGLTDGGGAMPVKKVRLPCGINGKAGEPGRFHVKLHELNADYYTPQELLDAAGIDINWDKYRTEVHTRQHKTRRIGATAWVPDLYYVNPHTGVYDPVLEFMYSQGMVLQDAQEKFMDVICPFHEEHTEQDLLSKRCGFSPLGHGMYPHKRVFKCFHDSCKSYDSADFIQRLHLKGGPLMPVSEYRPENVVNMVYDTVHDRVYDLKESGIMYGRKVEVINRVTPKVAIPGDKKDRMVDQLPLWLKQPSALKVSGPVYDARTRDRLVRDSTGQLRVNLFTAPDYPPVTPDEAKINPFHHFMQYLIPDKNERDYLIKWLACKVQNPTFRGPAVVLVSQTQGTGKNTLMKIIDRLFGDNGSTQLNIEELLASSGFNEWVLKPFVNVNEVLAMNDVRMSRRAYNRLKELVDPAPMPATANPKYGSKIDVICTTSFLFFSNHLDAVYLHQGDRRFFACEGPTVAGNADFFREIYAWLESDGWQPHLWAWLNSVEVDMADMMQPPPRTRMMDEIEFESTSPLEATVKAAIEVWPSPLVPPSVIKELLVQYVPRGIPENYKHIAHKMISDRLLSMSKYPDAARTKKIRVSLKPAFAAYVTNPEWRVGAIAETAAMLEKFDEESFRQAVDDKLEEWGYEF